ncbi:hypothetical protein SCALM49S_04114 [Streptomyces californicus]
MLSVWHPATKMQQGRRVLDRDERQRPAQLAPSVREPGGCPVPRRGLGRLPTLLRRLPGLELAVPHDALE